MEALDQGLAQSSLTSFYYLCRAVLIKSETEYDKFDIGFRRIFPRGGTRGGYSGGGMGLAGEQI